MSTVDLVQVLEVHGVRLGSNVTRDDVLTAATEALAARLPFATEVAMRGKEAAEILAHDEAGQMGALRAVARELAKVERYDLAAAVFSVAWKLEPRRASEQERLLGDLAEGGAPAGAHGGRRSRRVA